MQRNDLDEFWDVGKLLPKRKIKTGSQADTSAVEITDGSSGKETESGGESERILSVRRRERITPSHIRSYEPDNVFIKKVGVYTYPSDYRYYEDFRVTMHKYLRVTVAEAERVPFFSYLPQYSQLNSGRLSWYLYWRSGCRRREYMPTDFSYVLLYIYELINFENPRHPDRIAEELCSLWRAYREEFRQLDRYLPDWLCDYCLIHGVRLPYDMISDFILDVVEYASLGEFYFGDPSGKKSSYSTFIVCSASGYNYKKSKYYADNKEAYDLHIPGAAAYALGIEDTERSSAEEPKTIVKNDVFVGALCTSAARKSLRIEYVSASRSGVVRTEATLAVKYAENKLRETFGIRSRLDVRGLPDELRSRIDGYFADLFGVNTGLSRKSEPDYMAYYENEKKGIEYKKALEIERSSWETTALMCESFDEDTEVSEPADAESERASVFETYTDSGAESEDIYSEDGGYSALFRALDQTEAEVLSCTYKKDQRGAAAAAQKSAAYIGVICDEINEKALEHTGDILIECANGEYYVIADYESEVEKWLKI